MGFGALFMAFALLALGAFVVVVAVTAGGYLHAIVTRYLRVGPPPSTALLEQHGELNLAAQSLGFRHLGDHTYRGHRGWLQITLASLSAEPPRVSLAISGTPPRVSLFPVLIAEAREVSLETGDGAFDRRFQLQGDPRCAIAAVDAPTRAALLALPGYAALHMVDGELEAEITGVADADGLVRIAEQILQICEGLGGGDDASARLLVAARPGAPRSVRERALIALLSSRETRSGARREAAWMARGFENPELRLLGVINLGMDGLEEMLAILEDPGKHPDVRSVVLRALPDDAPEEQYTRAITLALQDPDLGLKLTAAVMLSRRVCALPPASEVPLIGLLELVDAAQVTLVVSALREAGTVRAVERLLAVADDRFAESTQREQARQAIKTIQARAMHAEAGAFSLSHDDAGALSLAPGEGGALSLDEG